MRTLSLELIETGSFANNRVTRNRRDAIRVVSWNIARGCRLDEILEFLTHSNTDLAILQEADRNACRSGRRDVAAEIAKRLGMNYAFGIEFEELSQGSRASPAHHGQATLTLLPLLDSRVLRFRRQSNFWHPFWFVPKLAMFQRRLGGRMALLTHLQIGRRTLVIYNLHLESRSEDIRQAQLAELLDDTRRYDGDTPVVVAGDFNLDVTENSVTSAIHEQFQNPFREQRVPTTRSHPPGRNSVTIDWILLRGPLRATDAQVHTSVSASDHYPLSLTLHAR